MISEGSFDTENLKWWCWKFSFKWDFEIYSTVIWNCISIFHNTTVLI